MRIEACELKQRKPNLIYMSLRIYCLLVHLYTPSVFETYVSYARPSFSFSSDRGGWGGDEVFHPNKINPGLTQLDIGLIHLVDARALTTTCHIQPRFC